MILSRKLALIALLSTATHWLPADADSPREPLYGAANLCYLEALQAQRNTNPDLLQVTSCNRALHFQRLSREAKSMTLHNRGIIEQAKGDIEAARHSFERAVSLSRTVDMRNLALAQLAHQQGDYFTAVAEYDALIRAAESNSALAIDRDVLLRNRARAAQSMQIADLGPLLDHSGESDGG